MYFQLFPLFVTLTITKGLQDILTLYCSIVPSRRFSGIDHRGALIAVSYGDGYLSNMTIPVSLLDRAMTHGSEEQQYLFANPDLILIPYFQGVNSEFSQNKDFYLEEMAKEWPYFQFLLLITGKAYALFHTASKGEIPIVVTDHMPVCLQDKVSAFLVFLKTRRLINN